MSYGILHWPKNPLCFTYSSFSSSLNIGNHYSFTESVVLSFPECQVVGIVWFMTFFDWLLLTAFSPDSFGWFSDHCWESKVTFLLLLEQEILQEQSTWRVAGQRKMPLIALLLNTVVKKAWTAVSLTSSSGVLHFYLPQGLTPNFPTILFSLSLQCPLIFPSLSTLLFLWI